MAKFWKRFYLIPILIGIFLIYFIFIVKVQNYDLLISPNKITPLSPFYYLKEARNNLQSRFIFGPEDTANWYLTLAGKRLDEAQILKARHFDSLANNQLQQAKDYQKKADFLLKSLKDKADINYLLDIYSKNEIRIKNFQ